VRDAAASVLATGSYGIAFVDPARRDGHGRRFDPRQGSPGWDLVTALLRGSAAAKVAPGLDHDLVPEDVEAEWVSDRGELVEACGWGAPLAPVRPRAPAQPSCQTPTDADDRRAGGARAPGCYLYEPHDAVRRAPPAPAVSPH